MKMLKQIILFFAVLNALSILGQKSDIKFEHISIEQGLSQSNIMCITQDSEGFMWFGTYDGLNKYNGYEIKVYRNQPDNPKSVSDNYINAIYEDYTGNIWVGTRSAGLCLYDKYQDEFETYKNNPKSKFTISDNNIRCIFQDSRGVLWIGTNNGLNKLVLSGAIDPVEYPDSSLIEDKKSVDVELFPDDEGVVTYSDDTSEKIMVIDGVGEVMLPDEDEIPKSDPEDIRISNKPLREDNDGQVIYGEQPVKYEDFFVGIKLTDSLHFTTYTQNSVVPNGIGGKDIFQIAELENGNLLLANENGIDEFDPRTEMVVYHITDLRDEFNNTLDVLSFFIDRKGYIWVGTNKGLKKYSKNYNLLKTYSYDELDINTISGNNVTSIIEDKYGILWVGTLNNGLNQFDPYKEKFTHYKNDPSNLFSLSVDHIKYLYFDKADILWIGTNLGGINKWDRTAAGIALYRKNPFNSNSLNSNQIRTIFKDNESNIVYIGTVDGGLNQWNLSTNLFTHFVHDPANKNSISNNHIRSIFKDDDNTMWFGTNGGGICLLKPGSEDFSIVKHNPKEPYSLSNDFIWDIYKDSKGVIWVGTFGGGLNKYIREDNSFIHYENIDRDPKSLSDNRVSAIYEDTKGTLWIGTFGGGLNKWDPVNFEFTHYKYDVKNKNSLGDNRVYSIFEDSDSILWIGTKASLNRFERDTETFTRYTEKDGLPNNVVMGILEDDKDNLWLSTNNGIAKFNKETKIIRNYDVKNGLQSNEFLVGSYFEDEDGMMYFGGINGLNVFHPDSVKNNQHPPQMVITDFKLFNRSVIPSEDSPLKVDISKTKSITLNHKQNAFSFEFAALHFSQPEKNQYRYMMKNFINEWIYTDSKHRIATYTNLDPGIYIFTVQGSNSDGIWNDTGVSLTVEVLPPFWETWWFIAIMVVFAISIVYMMYRSRIKRIEKQKNILEELVKQRTAQVEQQKEELSAQRDDLEKQNGKIEMQNEQIRSSIRYALTIQSAILPIEESMRHLFDFFLVYRPKDIVSGDFYWFSRIPGENNGFDKLFVAAVDCTGHGVPGAFMSLIGNRLLSEIINERKIFSPGKILDLLNKGVRSALKQDQTDNSEGMDMCLCMIEQINDNESKVVFSGAKRPLFYYRQGNEEISSIKGDRKSIGGVQSRLDDVAYSERELVLNSGDLIYLTTDGIIDQNAPDRKRFGSLKFKEVLRKNVMLPMEEQKETIENVLDLYMQGAEQRDDITVFGIRIR